MPLAAAVALLVPLLLPMELGAEENVPSQVVTSRWNDLEVLVPRPPAMGRAFQWSLSPVTCRLTDCREMPNVLVSRLGATFRV